MIDKTPRRWSPRTLAAQAMGHVDSITKAVVPPIHVATTYIRDPDNAYSSGFIYGRPDNATTQQAETVLAALEKAREALLFGSGMAAATAVFQACDPGDHILAPTVMYWALRHWLLTEATRWGLKIELIDMSNLDAVAAAMKPGQTKLIWIETPSNPLWTITDIAAVADIANRAGARLAVDSTVASPYHTRPLALNADIVMHSATKILNGHSDVVAGVLASNADDSFWTRVKTIRKLHGGIIGPLEAYLLIRGLRTFPLRAMEQAKTAHDLSLRLINHPAIAAVLYPGLQHHKGHAVATKQMENGFGAMLSIRLKNGEGDAVETGDIPGRRRKSHRASLLNRRCCLTLPSRLVALISRTRGCGGSLF